MSNVYQETPNIVSVQINDSTGTATRFIVGKSLDEVIALIDPAAPCAESKPKKKDRKPRRTKVDIAADKDLKSQGSAGEQAMDKLKKDATNETKGSVWP